MVDEPKVSLGFQSSRLTEQQLREVFKQFEDHQPSEEQKERQEKYREKLNNND